MAWQTFEKQRKLNTQTPAVSVIRAKTRTSAALCLNREAVRLVLGTLPAGNIAFDLLIDAETGRAGVRRSSGSEVNARRLRTGSKMPDGRRKLTNIWHISCTAFVRASALRHGRYLATLEEGVLVFGPLPEA